MLRHIDCDRCQNKDVHIHCKKCNMTVKRGDLKEHKINNHTKIIRCPDCRSNFRNEERLESHINWKHRGKRISCMLCQKTFSQFLTLQVHVKKCQESPFICGKCPKRCKTAQELDRHETLHCNLCSAQMLTPISLNKHIEKHKVSLTILCVKCNYKTIKNQSLQRHMFKHDTTLFKCEICEFKSKELHKFKYHKKVHFDACDQCDYKGMKLSIHKLNHDGFRCTLCTRVCDSKSSLIWHIKNVHDNASESLRCKYLKCQRKYATSEMAKLHYRSIHEGIGLSCEKCKYVGKNLAGLLVHIKKHERTTFYCNKCDFKTQFEKPFNVHRLRIHEGYKCDECETTVTTQNILYEHKRKHKGLQCRDCDFIGKDKIDRNKHERGHRPAYNCSVCSYSCKLKAKLNFHMERHKKNNGVTFECDICEFKSILPMGLKKHILAVHGQT